MLLIKVLHVCSGGSIQETRDDFEDVYIMLDPRLRPLEPDRTLEESVKIFNEHKQVPCITYFFFNYMRIWNSGIQTFVNSIVDKINCLLI